METAGKKKPRHRRSFTPEVKAEIVGACGRGDRTIGQVAWDFDLRRRCGRGSGRPTSTLVDETA